jgi:hypothetical protein
MNFRTVLTSVFTLGVVACLAAPAASTELPKEGVCKFKVSVEGKQVLTAIDYAKTDGVASWDENQKIVENCNGWPPMSRHCFGLNEMTKGAEFAYGFCVAKDADGDSIVWKLLPHSVESIDRIPDEVLMASGKYRGMNGKAMSQCTFSGTLTDYSGTCDVEMTYKIP